MSTSTPVRAAGDRTAILLSALCLVHCLVLPMFIALLPWLAWLVTNDDVVHRWLLAAIVPVSAYALIGGCVRHRRFAPVWLGLTAFGLLIVAATAETVRARESWLTVLGSVTLSGAHLLNLWSLRRGKERKDADE